MRAQAAQDVRPRQAWDETRTITADLQRGFPQELGLSGNMLGFLQDSSGRVAPLFRGVRTAIADYHHRLSTSARSTPCRAYTASSANSARCQSVPPDEAAADPRALVTASPDRPPSSLEQHAEEPVGSPQAGGPQSKKPQRDRIVARRVPSKRRTPYVMPDTASREVCALARSCIKRQTTLESVADAESATDCGPTPSMPSTPIRGSKPRTRSNQFGTERTSKEEPCHELTVLEAHDLSKK